jgi:hypothetical protein
MTHNPECGLDCVSAGAVRLDNTPSADQQTGRRDLSVTISGHVALIDAVDAHWLEKSKWYAVKHKRTHYLLGQIDGRRVRLHRMIMGEPVGMVIDHINDNGLDNRRSNLRVCTSQDNVRNMRKPRSGKTSKYKGVSLVRGERKYRAAIQIDGKAHVVGRFESQDDAARAYDAAALTVYGEFARLNFPNEGRDR